jgi:hypothetical protein
MKKLSRFVINKKVRQLFSKYRADFTQLSYSCTGRNLRLSGKLCREGGKDFKFRVLENLMKEIMKLGVNIVSELENVDVVNGEVMRRGFDKKQEKKKTNQSAFSNSVDEMLEVC